jgi:hypothetical protein
MSLPGDFGHVPAGSKEECNHCAQRGIENVPALYLLQGETDSFGAEYEYVCAACLDRALNKVRTGECEWCHSKDVVLKYARDYDEGSHGPTYLWCQPCIDKQEKELDREYQKYHSDGEDNWEGCD